MMKKGVLAIGIFGALGACRGEDCIRQETWTMMVPADQSCPGIDEARGLFGEEVDTLDVDPPSAAQTICWYRRPFRYEGDPQFWAENCEFFGMRDKLLAEATGLKPNTFSYGDTRSGERPLLACDAEGPLYGYVIAVPLPELSGASTLQPAECPASVTPPPEQDVITAEFVGRDFYPARTRCDYGATYDDICYNAGGPRIFGP